MSRTVLVIAPHADDETLGCGATITKWAMNGDRVFVAVMTNAAEGAPEIFTKQSITRVRNEALKAHEIIGVEKTFFFDLPAPKLEQYPQYKIANLILDTIKVVNPDIILVPHRGDLHKDHGTIFNASLVAARPFSLESRVSSILAYETLSETELGHPFPDTAFIPNFYVTVDETIFKKKLRAMSAYESQLRSFPHPRSLEALRSLAVFRGISISSPLAEAYMVVRIIEKEC